MKEFLYLKHSSRLFLNFFILLIFLNPFILIDAELLIFFSISLVILISTNLISEMLTNFLKSKLILYYYYFIRFYNLQLIFVYELIRFFKLNLFIHFLPIFLFWYSHYSTLLNDLFSIQNTQWNKIFNVFIFRTIKLFKLNFFHFYINFFHLLTTQVRERFRNIRLANFRLLGNYILKHLKYKKNKNRTRNAFLIRRDLPNLLKFLRLK